LSTLSAQRRYILGRTFQHRILRPAHHDDGTGMRPRVRRLHPHLWRCPHLQQPPGASQTATKPRTKTIAHHEDQSGGKGNLPI